MKPILFDLGNTLMQVEPFEKGPMVNWVNLALNENSLPETLRRLTSSYSLYIATNAQDSNYDQVLEALKRVGICRYFNDVFMKQTVGVEKSTPEYYQRILEKIKCPKDQVLMVGDDYLRDILFPHSIGIQTCFYNPTLKNEINSVSPIQNIECFQLKNLQGKLKRMLPSIDTCFNWLIENGAGHELL
ncbi:MAG: HAD-IA family hydrolase, partial [Anaerolineaceae bacterium]|nr:HAD-IA family hydrolase [Anaerolineaceae bacterium]